MKLPEFPPVAIFGQLPPLELELLDDVEDELVLLEDAPELDELEVLEVDEPELLLDVELELLLEVQLTMPPAPEEEEELGPPRPVGVMVREALSGLSPNSLMAVTAST